METRVNAWVSLMQTLRMIMLREGEGQLMRALRDGGRVCSVFSLVRSSTGVVGEGGG